MSYNVILITVLLFILWLVSLPMTLGYFRMGSKSIFKFTMIMSFKNILFTFLYVFIIWNVLAYLKYLVKLRKICKLHPVNLYMDWKSSPTASKFALVIFISLFINKIIIVIVIIIINISPNYRYTTLTF